MEIVSLFLSDSVRPCLVCTQKLFTMSHRIFRHMYRILNIDKKILITQIACKL
jgi:hypothetical protein